jgi:sulfatase modifying factor 1
MKKRRSQPSPVPPVPTRRRPLRYAVLGVLLCAGLALSAYALIPTGEGPPPAVPECWIPGGTFRMGDDEIDDARPVHTVHVDGFWMDQTEVTNEQFAWFVKKTGYVTVAERQPDAADFPGVSADKLVPFSGVFRPPAGCPPANECPSCGFWWVPCPGACWRHPEGPGSDLKGREKHPVVHVAWEDAVAYARWAGKRLPTEAEWERAARGPAGEQSGGRFYWGDELCPGGKWMANIWQGPFPIEDRGADGFRGTAPVGSFPPNGFGLYDMAGNVWEWCADWYRPDYYADSPRDNPRGPDSSIDPDGRDEPKRVQRGGSFLCSDNYCSRYRAGARGQGEPRTGLPHTGFRCVRSAP